MLDPMLNEPIDQADAGFGECCVFHVHRADTLQEGTQGLSSLS